MFDFANILFSGPCNARCPNCIGKRVDPRLNVNNLHHFPPKNLARFIDLLNQHQIRQVVFSGTNTDPLLYQHQEKLLALLRNRLLPDTRISLHTNGLLALKKIALFNSYDKVCISYPSFNRATYHKMMGVSKPPDIVSIFRQSKIPVKISALVTDINAHEINAFLETCEQIGIQRLVLRKLYAEKRPWNALINPKKLGLIFDGDYQGNPVYRFKELQVTLWDFEKAQCKSLNLFSSGLISEQYLLTQENLEPKSEVTLSTRQENIGEMRIIQ